ncbi:hypothetical protein BGW36DRAFT_435561 [Talaromyces proteolyticus]|uniref:Ecp2 effector protein domain-containing protein n=1 Tax=Talaromyces proteolyticus TaxID=1131652 RepID=A0AAD4Q6F6_9EURO|nr:uncharacterized protein BGW36DRAFT_435561 [Talaromyces proteolyticus]KAH8705656.1 hypothetical protein BGW36DRAFT_435561 [Talaromyces proteolyticus]
MKLNILTASTLSAISTLTSAYNLTLYTDESCSEGGTDFSAPDFQGGQGTVGTCTTIGFQAKSAWFTQDTDTEQQLSGWDDPQETCIASESGQSDADVTLYTYQPVDMSCQDITDGIYNAGDGIASFLVGVVG